MPKTTRRSNGDTNKSASSKRGRKPLPIVERPVPKFTDWVDPPSFREALVLHLGRFSESYYQLHRSIVRPEEKFDRATLQSWTEGRRAPQSAASLELLTRIERRYDLPLGYFKSKLEAEAR